jgi:hypothetical protein
MQRVFVLSSDCKPLDPCRPARARKLLKQGLAARSGGLAEARSAGALRI